MLSMYLDIFRTTSFVGVYVRSQFMRVISKIPDYLVGEGLFHDYQPVRFENRCASEDHLGL